MGGSPIGLTGCGIWLYLVLIFGIICIYGVWLWCGIGKGFHHLINWPEQKPQAGRNEPNVCIAVSGQVMDSNGSVPCQALYPISLDHSSIILSEVFESYRDHLCWPLTSMTFVHFHFKDSVCNLDTPILSSFSNLRPFSRLACFGQEAHTGWRW